MRVDVGTSAGRSDVVLPSPDEPAWQGAALFFVGGDEQGKTQASDKERVDSIEKADWLVVTKEQRGPTSSVTFWTGPQGKTRPASDVTKSLTRPPLGLILAELASPQSTTDVLHNSEAFTAWRRGHLLSYAKVRLKQSLDFRGWNDPRP